MIPTQTSVSECANPKVKRLTPMRAIKAKCLDCCCGSRQEVKVCPAMDCTLWIFRTGHKQAEKARHTPAIGHSPNN